MGRLENKVAVVLGAATEGNMGQVIARRFTQEGARVVVAGRHLDVLEQLASEIGGRAIYADILDKEQMRAMAQHAVEAFGGLDIGVQCTGWGLLKPFLDNTTEELDEMCRLQFRGPFEFMQVMIEHMRPGGSIIQISSATATIMLNNHAAYMGTKAGIDHVVRCVAFEQGERGIRANSISPGLTETPMAAPHMQTPGLTEAFLNEYPLGRINTAEDVAAGCVWLASDECFMTGQNLHVTGGLTLRRNPTAKEIETSIAEHMNAGGG